MSTSTTAAAAINNPAQFKYICRACRKVNRDMRPIFNSEVNAVQVSQILSFAVPINVRPDDKLPKSLCSPCLKKLIDVYKFLQMCIDSDVEMRNMLKHHFNPKSIIVEKIHNYQQHQNLIPTAAKPLLKSALLKNTEFKKTEMMPVQIQGQLSDNDTNTNTHIDVIEYDGTLIKFENQDYDEFDNFECEGNITSDNKVNDSMKMRNRNENISRLGNKNHDIIYSIDSRVVNTNLSCNFCEKVFIQKDDLDKHEAIHTCIKNNSTYIQKSPDFLDKSLTIKESFSPSSKSPQIIGKFSCAFCKNTFHTWENLAKHIGEHQIKSIYGTDNPGNPSNSLNKTDIEESAVVPHQCTYCLKRFAYRDDLICHMSEHINEINSAKNRENASDQLIKLQTIREIPIDIENEPPRLSDNESGEDSSKFYCQFCSSNYTVKASLRKHVLLKHKKNISNLEKYQCSYCGRLFVKYLDMIRHKKMHKENNLLKNIKTTSLANNKPKSIENKKPAYIQCQYCDNKIRHACNLKRHISKLHPEKLNNNIAKPTTNTVIKQKLNVVVSSPKDKKFKCHDCGKLYNTYLEMIRHRKTVHTIKSKVPTTYKCPHCPTLIKWSLANLKRHIKNVHKDISTSSELDPILVETQEEPVNVKQSPMKNKTIPIKRFKKFIKCQHCELTLCSQADVRRHMIKRHKELTSVGLKKYECMYCGKTFKKYFDMRSHQKHHKKRNDDILKPPEQNIAKNETNNFEIIEEISEIEATVNDEGTTDPLEINKGNKSLIPVQCNICSVVLTNIYSYNRHIKNVHGINENEQIMPKTEPEVIEGLNCKVCDKNFKTTNALNTHLLLKHSTYSNEITKTKSIQTNKDNLYNCSECEKSYEIKWSLMRHNKSCHSDAKYMNSNGLYECNICEKKFLKRLGYISHSRIHKKPLEDLRRKCLVCKKILKDTTQCRRHFRTYHLDKIKENEKAQTENDKHKCSICSKSFTRSDYYRCHIKRHLFFNEENNNSLSKTVTSKSEKIKEKSIKKEIANDEKPKQKITQQKQFHCIRCPTVFTNKEKYLKHAKNHKLKIQRIKHKQELFKKKMREKTYKCKICGKVISKISNFNSHMKAHERRKIKKEDEKLPQSVNPIQCDNENLDNKTIQNEEHMKLSEINNIVELKLNVETPNIIVNDQTEIVTD